MSIRFTLICLPIFRLVSKVGGFKEVSPMTSCKTCVHKVLRLNSYFRLRQMLGNYGNMCSNFGTFYEPEGSGFDTRRDE
jgi:hypothetical protein